MNSLSYSVKCGKIKASEKIASVREVNMEPKQYKNYIAGIYLRLSRDDERAGESLSIENQKILVTKYVKEKGWEIKDVYVDDGY